MHPDHSKVRGRGRTSGASGLREEDGPSPEHPTAPETSSEANGRETARGLTPASLPKPTPSLAKRHPGRGSWKQGTPAPPGPIPPHGSPLIKGPDTPSSIKNFLTKREQVATSPWPLSPPPVSEARCTLIHTYSITAVTTAEVGSSLRRDLQRLTLNPLHTSPN